MKKVILVLIMLCVYTCANAQVTNYEMKFRYNNADTLLSGAQIFLWNAAGNFPLYLKWKNIAFSLQPTGNEQIGLFTDSTHSFTTGDDVGWAFIKVANTGYFMNDYYNSSIGMMVNESETPNVEIISGSDGLMMRALANIAPNTEITAHYKDILDLFPTDETVKLLVHK